MKKILFINACVRKESRTKRLAEELLAILGGEIHEMNLEEMNLQPLTEKALAHREMLISEKKYDDPVFEPAHRFADADILVFAAPYWDCSYPASVKVYIENIMINGITFSYTEEGYPVGMCRAEKVFYISTAGGPVIGSNLGYEYIRTLAGAYWGIPDSRLYQVENLDIYGADIEKIMRDAIETIQKERTRD